MSPVTVGERQRPRVAVIGCDEEHIEEHQLLLEWLQRRFRTVWHGYSPNALGVHHSEIDLTINLSGNPGSFAQNHHLISFNYEPVPGPCDHTYVGSDSHSLLSEYHFPDNHSLPIDKRRKADLRSLGSARKVNILEIQRGSGSHISDEKISEAHNKLVEGALAISSVPMATIYMRENDKGVAVLPLDQFDKKAWIDILVDEWSQIDPVSFPDGGGQWSKTPEWMTPEEQGLVEEIDIIEAEKTAMIAQLDAAIADKEACLSQLRKEVNNGRRSLLTEQGDSLVEKVEEAFRDIGFGVKNMDRELEEGQQKREDLRLTDPDSPEWEAIVEVKGYTRSDGKTSDLLKIQRFVAFYQSEKGKLPSKIIYVVNGPIEISPGQRGTVKPYF